MWKTCVVGLAVALTAAGCHACRSTSSTTESEAPAAATYRPPAESATSLVESVRARRDASSGQVRIDGRLLLPMGARIWVDVYPAGVAQSADPIDRAELYLAANGTFEAGPFKVPAADSQVRILVTSYFTTSWQPPDVIALVGLGGMKLPKAALRLDRPGAPGMGAHLEESATVRIGS
jgi:hypothetical protein